MLKRCCKLRNWSCGSLSSYEEILINKVPTLSVPFTLHLNRCTTYDGGNWDGEAFLISAILDFIYYVGRQAYSFVCLFLIVLDHWLSALTSNGENLPLRTTLGHSPMRCLWGTVFAPSCIRHPQSICSCVANHCTGAPGQLWALGNADGEQKQDGTTLQRLATARRWCLSGIGSSAPCRECGSSRASSVENVSEIQPPNSKGASCKWLYLVYKLKMSLIYSNDPRWTASFFLEWFNQKVCAWGGLGSHPRFQ